ncbi:hypothetical protein Pelo_17269 [Pelomyxa schiedti]|nr:hypothetical protein Pelo_17269 [Pelomyxa schiedti]
MMPLPEHSENMFVSLPDQWSTPQGSGVGGLMQQPPALLPTTYNFHNEESPFSCDESGFWKQQERKLLEQDQQAETAAKISAECHSFPNKNAKKLKQAELYPTNIDQCFENIKVQDDPSHNNFQTTVVEEPCKTILCEEVEPEDTAPSPQSPVENLLGQIHKFQPPAPMSNHLQAPIMVTQSGERLSHIRQPPNSPLQSLPLVQSYPSQQTETLIPQLDPQIQTQLPPLVVGSRAEQHVNPIPFRAEENLIVTRSSKDRNNRKYEDASNCGVHHHTSVSIDGNVELSLSTSEIFKHKRFSFIIRVRLEWKKQKNLSTAAILVAGLNAKCCKEGTNEELACEICPTNQIVRIGIIGQAYSQSITQSNGFEQFLYGDCESICTSSRDHLHTALCLVVRLSPESIISSPSFVLRARADQNRKRRPQTTPKIEVPRGSLSSLPFVVTENRKRRCTNTREMSRGGRPINPPPASTQVNACHYDHGAPTGRVLVHTLRSSYPPAVETIVNHLRKIWKDNQQGVINFVTDYAETQPVGNQEAHIHLFTLVRDRVAADAFSALLHRHIIGKNLTIISEVLSPDFGIIPPLNPSQQP